jgi:hypothetical protein
VPRAGKEHRFGGRTNRMAVIAGVKGGEHPAQQLLYHYNILYQQKIIVITPRSLDQTTDCPYWVQIYITPRLLNSRPFHLRHNTLKSLQNG